jgi:hypothetical protein
MGKGITPEYRCLRCNAVHQGPTLSDPRPSALEIMGNILREMNGLGGISTMGGREPDTFPTHTLHNCEGARVGISHLIGAVLE